LSVIICCSLNNNNQRKPMSSYAEEEQDAREYAELQRQFAEEREEEARHDGDVIKHEGKTFHFEMLDNGLIRTYDYECKWPLLFKRNENGEWKPENLNARTEAYKGLAMKLNETIQPTYSVGDDGEPMI